MKRNLNNIIRRLLPLAITVNIYISVLACDNTIADKVADELLACAIQEQNIVKINRALISGANINFYDETLELTPLAMAIRQKSKEPEEILQLLLRRGANPNNEHCPALFFAIVNFKLKAAQLLLDKGVDIDQNYNLMAPLSYLLDSYCLMVDDFRLNNDKQGKMLDKRLIDSFTFLIDNGASVFDKYSGFKFSRSRLYVPFVVVVNKALHGTEFQKITIKAARNEITVALKMHNDIRDMSRDCFYR